MVLQGLLQGVSRLFAATAEELCFVGVDAFCSKFARYAAFERKFCHCLGWAVVHIEKLSYLAGVACSGYTAGISPLLEPQSP